MKNSSSSGCSSSDGPAPAAAAAAPTPAVAPTRQHQLPPRKMSRHLDQCKGAPASSSATTAAAAAEEQEAAAVRGIELVGDYRSSSSVSTGRRCDECKIAIHQLVWLRCNICKAVDLCQACSRGLRKKSLDHRDSESNLIIPHLPDEHLLCPFTWEHHYFVKLSYAESQQPASNERLLQVRDKKVKELLAQDGEIRSSRDVWLLKRLLKPKKAVHPSDTQDNIREKLMEHVVEEANKPPVKILSIDGGGVRGVLTIKVLQHLISRLDTLFDFIELPKDTFPDIGQVPDDDDMKKQRKFARHFQYIAGTSNGALLAYALATDLPLSRIEALYTDKKFFKASDYSEANFWTRAWGWVPWLPELLASSGFHWDRAKYDPAPIHKVIDGILLEQFPKKDFPNGATIRDLDRLLNSHRVNPDDKNGELLPSEHHRSLVINTFEAATNQVLMVDSSSSAYAERPLADILKGTMAAPFYFPPHTADRTYLDGGIFANDPMLAGLHCALMNGNISSDYSEYRLVGIGAGVSQSSLSGMAKSPPNGGIHTWLLGEVKAQVLNTVLEANRSLTETISTGLANFQRIRRIKFNINLAKPPELDDFNFANTMRGAVWNKIAQSQDMKALEQFLKHQMG